MPDTSESKQAWRRALRETSRLVTHGDRRDADAALAERVKERVLADGTDFLLAFAPLPDEPDIAPFLRHWLAEGGKLALPAWTGGSDMILRRVADLDADLRPGRASIPEPLDSLPEVAPEEIDAAVVPGRAFSENCRRLGRGAGCYDRLLRGRTMRRIGVAYDYQIFPRVPASPDDEDMDMILTPSRVIVNAGRAARTERKAPQ